MIIMVHKKDSKIRRWFSEHKGMIEFWEREGMLFAGAGVIASGIISGDIPPSMGEPIVTAVTMGTALNVIKRSEEMEKK